MPKEEQEKYHKNLKVHRDLMNSFNTANKVGFKQGLKKGLKEGKEEGIKEGLKEGIKQEKLEIAKKLLLAEMAMEFIVDTTGLSVEEIEDLKS